MAVDVKNLQQLWSLPNSILVIFVLYCIYGVLVGVYRLFLSPLAKFPGSRVAALTFWYEFYFDLIKGGKYEFEIERMHDKYGPVVRINPEELHVMDPDFYDILYAGANKRRDKWFWSCAVFGANSSSFSTVGHEHHRQRRSVLNPSFSKKSVTSLEPSLREHVETLCVRIREYQRSQQPLRVRDAFAALTLDTITEYCLAFSFDSLNHPDLNSEGVRSGDKLTRNAPLMKHFQWIFPMTKLMPEWLVLKLFPNMANTLNLQSILRNQASSIKNGDQEELKSSKSTILHRILHSDLPPEEKEVQRLVEECQTIIGAGQITTADTLERATFELLSNPHVLKKLKEELESAMPNPNQLLSWKDLEQLPYLSAVISETLRVTSPAPGRFQRIAPDENLEVQGFSIPAGTPVGMSAYLMHNRNPQFPEPEKFRPERWLCSEKDRRQLEKYLVPFGKGTRMCLGMNLAEAELYITLAVIFRRFDMELFETTLEEVRYCHDYVTPYPYEGSERVRVIVKS